MERRELKEIYRNIDKKQHMDVHNKRKIQKRQQTQKN